MAEPMSLQGPVLKVNGELMLLIPLEDGGAAEVEGARGVCDAQGSYLKVAIPEWIAGLLRIEEIFFATSPSAKTLQPDECPPFKERWLGRYISE